MKNYINYGIPNMVKVQKILNLQGIVNSDIVNIEVLTGKIYY